MFVLKFGKEKEKRTQGDKVWKSKRKQNQINVLVTPKRRDISPSTGRDCFCGGELILATGSEPYAIGFAPKDEPNDEEDDRPKPLSPLSENGKKLFFSTQNSWLNKRPHIDVIFI